MSAIDPAVVEEVARALRDPVTAVDVDALAKLREAATPGPWITEPNYQLEKGCRCLSCWEPIPDSWDISPIDGPDCPQHGCWHSVSLGQADAALIVAAVNALPDLLAEVRRGRALREAVEGLAEELGNLPGLREREYVADRLRAVVADHLDPGA